MLVGKNKLEKCSAKASGPVTVAARKSGQKMSGTRAGTLEDWRQDCGKVGKNSVGRGNTLRDGR